MAAEQGNRKLREMSWGRARELCRVILRDYPEDEKKYLQWCNDNHDQLQTMNAGYRGIGPDFIHAKVKN